jgi:hypothetical protein
VTNPGQSVMVCPARELFDADGMPVAVQTADLTRGQARAYFAFDSDLTFIEVKLRRAWYYDSPAYRAEMEEDGAEEPYDGWPLTECDPGTPGAAEFWVLTEECRS